MTCLTTLVFALAFSAAAAGTAVAIDGWTVT